MRRSALLIAMTVVTGSGLALGIGCGDDEVPPVGAGAVDASTSNADGATDPGSSGGPGTIDPNDAGIDGALPNIDGPNPGRVTCGATECDRDGGNVCCVRNADAGQTVACSSAAECTGTRTVELACDEPGDCVRDGGTKRFCCLSFTRFGGSSACANRSTLPIPFPTTCNIELCKADSDCGDGGTCGKKTCTVGTTTATVDVCGTPQGCKE